MLLLWSCLLWSYLSPVCPSAVSPGSYSSGNEASDRLRPSSPGVSLEDVMVGSLGSASGVRVVELHHRPHAVSAARWGYGNSSFEAERIEEALSIQRVRVVKTIPSSLVFPLMEQSSDGAAS